MMQDYSYANRAGMGGFGSFADRQRMPPFEEAEYQTQPSFNGGPMPPQQEQEQAIQLQPNGLGGGMMPPQSGPDFAGAGHQMMPPITSGFAPGGGDPMQHEQIMQRERAIQHAKMQQEQAQQQSYGSPMPPQSDFARPMPVQVNGQPGPMPMQTAPTSLSSLRPQPDQARENNGVNSDAFAARHPFIAQRARTMEPQQARRMIQSRMPPQMASRMAGQRRPMPPTRLGDMRRAPMQQPPSMARGGMTRG